MSAIPLPFSRAAAWRPGLAETARHSEVFASSREGAGAALALAFAQDGLAADERPWLWVQDAAALRLSGRPYRPGLPAALRHRLIHVAAKSPEDALFALEEGLRCRDLAFVIGELAGNPKALGFTASRRLSLVAEKHGVPLWLVRLDAARDLGSARLRWAARAAPSAPPRWNGQAPGAPAWHAELFRARGHPPGEWVLGEEEEGLVAASVSVGPSTSSGRADVFPRPAQAELVEARAHA
jgi:protein ImuA